MLKNALQRLCGHRDASPAAQRPGQGAGTSAQVQMTAMPSSAADPHDRAERGAPEQAAVPPSADAEPTLHIDCRRRADTRMGVRVRAEAEATRAAQQAGKLLDRLYSARPPVQTITALAEQGQHMQGTLVHYRGPAGQPQAAVCEAFYTHVPGIMLAALVVQPETAAGPAEAAEAADQTAGRLGAPPLALATGVWTAGDGNSYLVHNNRLHRARPSVAARLSAWEDITPARGPAVRLQMLGRQADGGVWLRQGDQLLRLGGAAAVVLQLPQGLPDRLPLCMDAQGRAHALSNGLLTELASGAPSAPRALPRELRLMRRAADGTAEPSPARPSQLLMVGQGAQAQALVVDHRGRLYQANLHARSAGHAVHAHRVAWPAVLGPSAEWAVTAAGLSPQGEAQVVIEHKEGRCVSLLQAQPGGAWRLQFDMDQPLLLVGQEGLAAPSNAQMQSSIRSLDGHARLGVAAGTACYSPSPGHAWTELQDVDGRALDGVSLLETSAFGFIDRKPMVAIRQGQPAAPAEVIALRVQGRTTLLPARPAEDAASAAPLTVVPSRVTVHPVPLGRLPAGGVARSLAADKDGHVFVLHAAAQSLSLYTNHPHLPTQGTPGALLPQLPLPAGVQTMAVAVAGDNRLHALCGDGAARQLQVLQPDGQWQPLPLPLAVPAAEGQPALQANELRTSRHGTLEVGMRVQADELAPVRWHAVLPGMVRGADGQWSPGRLDPEPSRSDRVAAGLHAATNQTVDRQGALRVPLGNGTIRFDTTLLGNRSTDPRLLISNLVNLATTTAGHVQAMGGHVVNSFQHLLVAVNLRSVQTAARERILPIVAEAASAHGELRTWVTRQALPPAATALPRLRRAVVSAADDMAGATSARLATLRRDELQRTLGDLQKIAIRAGVLSPDLRRNAGGSTGTTFSYVSEEHVLAYARGAVAAVNHARGRVSEDMLPALQAFWNRVDVSDLPADEQAPVHAIRAVLGDLGAGGVQLPSSLGARAAAGTPDEHVPTDAHAIRSADAARASMQFERLLAARDLQAAEQLHERAQASELRRLARSGMSSWSEVEAFDRVVTDFRAAVADPKSPRRQQLLKSLGLPRQAAPDQMAARMAELMQDLYNRSTFFSIETQSVTAALNLKGPGMLKEAGAVTPGLTIETTHLLGVERIGDSIDDDAGLVAFFVEQSKQRVAVSGGVRVATHDGAGEAPVDDDGADQLTSKIAWGGAAGGRLQLGRLRGVGMALLVPRDQIAAFAQSLMAPVDEPPRLLYRMGSEEGGAIGLNLLETQAEATANMAYNVDHPLWEYLFGAAKPRAPAAGGAGPSAQAAGAGPSAPAGAAPRALLQQQATLPDPAASGSADGYYGSPDMPGGYVQASPARPEPPPGADGPPPGNGTSPARPAPPSDPGRRGTFGFGLPAAGRGEAKASWQEMELHLDHAWAQILGLEFQGHAQFNVGLSLGARGTAGLTGSLGRLAEDLTSLNTGVAGLQLAGINVSTPDVLRVPGTVTATYKRTLDARVAAPLGAQDWDRLQRMVAQAFPRQTLAPIEGPLPQVPTQQRQALAGLVQAIEGHAHGAISALGDEALEAQRRQARTQDEQAQAAGGLPVAPSAVARTQVLDTARQMVQQLDAALANRALLIPGARIEINTLGKAALDGTMRLALGHWGLGTAKMREVPDAVDQVPGLAAVMLAMQHMPMVDQVRFVFEMRPQAIAAINDALALKEVVDAAGANGAAALAAADAQALPTMDWQTLLVQARTNPELYRLAAIVVHNTDDNPTTASYQLGPFSQSHTGSASHQLFGAEVQLRYGPQDELVAVQMLESAGRAVQQQLQPLRDAGVEAVGRVSQAGDPARYGPPSPRLGSGGAGSSRPGGAGPSR